MEEYQIIGTKCEVAEHGYAQTWKFNVPEGVEVKNAYITFETEEAKKKKEKIIERDLVNAIKNKITMLKDKRTSIKLK